MPQYITIYKYIYLHKYKYYLFTYVNHELYNIYNNLFIGSLSVMAAKLNISPFKRGDIQYNNNSTLGISNMLSRGEIQC